MWDERPLLREDLEWVWRAWGRLTTCRTYTMAGAAPIPWTAVDAYAERHGIHGEDFEELEEYVAAMDSAYLAHVNKEAPGKK